MEGERWKAEPSAIDPDDLRRVGLDAGLDAVGYTSADVLEPARSVLPRRREAGLAATMAFTYRNPDRSTDPGRVVKGAQSLVVGLRHYGADGDDVHGHDEGDGAGPVGLVARYARHDHYRDLREALGAMARVLKEAGHRAVVVADSNDLVDRNAAWRAGLGWYGKNANLLAEGRGSWFVIGAVVTDAELPAAPEPVVDGCGPCTTCIDQCPTQAIVAPGVVDARRCIAWLVQAAEPIPVEHREAVGGWLYGCDICQEVCPPNRLTVRRRSQPVVRDLEPGEETVDPPPRWGPASIELTWVLEADDDALLARCGRWYIANRDPDVIRRTALIVLGNRAEPGSASAARLLERYSRHANPLLRSHAVWAARRLGLDQHVAHTSVDAESIVAEEWGHPVRPRGATPGGRR